MFSFPRNGVLSYINLVEKVITFPQMKDHDGGVYAIFNKKFSTFALYEGKDGEGFHPYQVSLKFNTRDQDEMIIADLRKWLANSKVIDGKIFIS